MRKRRAFVGAIALLLALAVVYRKIGMPRPDRSPATSPPTAVAPAGSRMRVEVLNASVVRGLARRATIHLRDEGFDVVQSGTTNERRDSTLILDRTNHPEWAARAARAMGGARIESRPDTLRDVDLTVLVGAGWRPPAEPFYP
jgi:hypothetical protein